MHIYVILVCGITGLIILSNSLSIALLVCIALDPFAIPQGVDYCIFSLAISDLVAGLLIGPVSMISLDAKSWIFGEMLCKTLGFVIFALWAVNVYSLFWLSVDRLLYITDTKYCTYKMRTRARCICKIVLSWIMSVLFSLVPLIVNKNATFLHQSAVCIIDWFTVEAYYITVTSIVIVPCFCATIYNFSRIYFWRLKYRTGFLKLKAANVEYLLEPSHQMSLILVAVFWFSWLPYVIHLIQYKVNGPRTPTFIDVWIGFAQSVWKFPIMVMGCPRYRNYFRDFAHMLCPTLSCWRENRYGGGGNGSNARTNSTSGIGVLGTTRRYNTSNSGIRLGSSNDTVEYYGGTGGGSCDSKFVDTITDTTLDMFGIFQHQNGNLLLNGKIQQPQREKSIGACSGGGIGGGGGSRGGNGIGRRGNSDDFEIYM